MRVLLDESVPHDLIALLTGHDVVTVQGQGWAGTLNGELLKRASGIVEAFVTLDRKLERELLRDSRPDNSSELVPNSGCRELDFVLADGSTLTRQVSECRFEMAGRRATSQVVLGETEDKALLGAVTLETLGLILNPLNRTLSPMRMLLA